MGEKINKKNNKPKKLNTKIEEHKISWLKLTIRYATMMG